VRELSNVIERAVVLARGPVLDVAAELLPGAASAGAVQASAAAAWAPASETLEAHERRHIEETLERSGWMIEGARGAAAVLGLSASTRRSRMKKLGVRRPAR
jgi:DNA-binding NtrC family response regulator